MSKYKKSKKGRFKMINLNSEINRRITTKLILGSVIITWKKKEKNYSTTLEICSAQKIGLLLRDAVIT